MKKLFYFLSLICAIQGTHLKCSETPLQELTTQMRELNIKKGVLEEQLQKLEGEKDMARILELTKQIADLEQQGIALIEAFEEKEAEYDPTAAVREYIEAQAQEKLTREIITETTLKKLRKQLIQMKKWDPRKVRLMRKIKELEASIAPD